MKNWNSITIGDERRMLPIPVVITVIVSSFLLSILAMGFTLQYITLSVPNLAYATIAFASTYISLTVTLMGLSPYISAPFAFILGGLISLLLYRFMAYLRDRGATVVGLMISTLVFDLTIYGATNIYAGYIAYFFKTYAYSFSLSQFDFNFGVVPGILIVTTLASVTLVIIFHTLLIKTKFGIAMRAVMENYSLASTQGIDTEKVLSVAWFFVGGVAGISGSLYPLWFYMDPWVGARTFISIFAGCVVGGLRSIYGSLLGGFVIGASEILITYAFAGIFGGWLWAYRAVTPMIIAVLALIMMPDGIAGYLSRARAR
jgi:branched-chain amino acid transport system permease protein